MIANVFIADDHTLIRQGLRRLIENVQGYRVIGETGDGFSILPLVRKLKPDVIILDISMPNLRGIEAISKIRRVDKKVDILVITMHKNEDYVYECLVNGAQGYLLKEDAESDMVSALQALRQNKIYISPSFTSDVIKKLIYRTVAKDGSSTSILTTREREILKLIADGLPNRQIARLLTISVRTVEHHRANIMRKLGISNLAGLVRYALKTELID